VELSEFTNDELSIELAHRFDKPGMFMTTLVQELRKVRKDGNIFCLTHPLTANEMIRSMAMFWHYTHFFPKEEWDAIEKELTMLRAENAYLKASDQDKRLKKLEEDHV